MTYLEIESKFKKQVYSLFAFYRSTYEYLDRYTISLILIHFQLQKFYTCIKSQLIIYLTS